MKLSIIVPILFSLSCLETVSGSTISDVNDDGINSIGGGGGIQSHDVLNRHLVATDDRTLYCGVPNKCAALGGNIVTTSKSTLAGVRCCTGNASLGWPYKCRSSSNNGVYGESNVPSCYRSSTFDDAVAICGAYDGGRLCTGAEILDRCTAGTGCSLNKALVWACSANSASCTASAECCSGLCNGGVCEDVNGPDTSSPSTSPTKEPTLAPTTSSPSPNPTSSPSLKPTNSPSTSPSKSPTLGPVTNQPTSSPSRSPITSDPTKEPSTSPSKQPTLKPITSSSTPTTGPSDSPSSNPTMSPSKVPTSTPSLSPSSSPSKSPTKRPSVSPSSNPTVVPTGSPSNGPTSNPSQFPSKAPLNPTGVPSVSPTNSPSSPPIPVSDSPTTSPSRTPSTSPTTPCDPFSELVMNGDFEDGLSPYWLANSNSMTLQLNTTDRGYSALNSGRTATWQGVSQDLEPSCMQKVKYFLSCYAKIASGSLLSTDNFKLTMRITDTNGVKKWKTVQGSINDNNWSFISGTINLADIDGDIADVRIYAQGADLQTSYLVDDVSAILFVTEAPSESPSKIPTGAPSKEPTSSPTTSSPSLSPSKFPTKSPSAKPSASPNNGMVNGEVDVPIIPNESDITIVLLPPSTMNKLITVSQVSDDNVDTVPVARSYDGRDYDTLHPLLLSVDCVEGSCSVELPPNTSGSVMHYIIKEFSPDVKTDKEDKARLLLQATYGPTEESLAEAVALISPANWVQDQIDNKPATLLRSHYRQRTSGHIRTNLNHHGTKPACETGSRWVRYSFNRWKDIGKTINEVPSGSGTWYLTVDGIVRTEVNTQPSVEFSLSGTSYVICRVVTDHLQMSSFVSAPTGEKGKLTVASSSSACMSSPVVIDMPAVSFSNDGGIPVVNLQDLADTNVLDTKILQDFVSPSTCDDFKKTWPNFVKDAATGLFYVEDRRAQFYDNTDGATTEKKQMLSSRCPQVDKTFLNEDTCVIRTDCSPPVFDGGFELNAQNLRKFYELDEKYVYRVENLPLIGTSTPCSTNSNRFVRKNADGDTSNGCGGQDTSDIFPEVAAAISNYLSSLSASDQDKKRVIDLEDIDIPCTDSSDTALGASFTVTIPGSGASSCWTHSYRYEWSVIVMNDWVANHPGNPVRFRASRPNPIAYVAEHENTGDLEDSVTLTYPPWGFHASNFHNNRWRFTDEILGSWGDYVQFDDLPDSAKSKAVMTELGGALVAESGGPIEVCGSPGEVSSDPTLGHQYYLQKSGDADEELPDALDQDHYRWHSNKMIWNTVALTASDQLRQRVAWALASIFVVTETDIAMEEVAESWTTYYDIFVRNSFGSFAQVLKEVSFSPMMGKMLTYEGSKSLAYQIEKNNAEFFPDENFAREIMQLFSIGLYMLNQDGTYKIDQETGLPQETYDNNDIENFSRAWTNFVKNPNDRDNIEPEWSTSSYSNNIDPMILPTSEGRDTSPKQTLLVDGRRGYIGDQLQRCDALPDKPWLRKGAVWEFRETQQSLMGKQDPLWWPGSYDWTARMILQPSTSQLYDELCNADSTTGECQWLSTAVLSKDIVCDGTCNARQGQWWDEVTLPCECSIDLPRTVEIQLSPTKSIWYEYKEAPCVQMAYPEVVNTVKEIGHDSWSEQYGYGSDAMCADSRLAVAGTTCCDSTGARINICVFRGERTTYQTAVDRCQSYGAGYSTCSWDTVTPNWGCGTDLDYWQGDWSVHKSPGMRFSWNAAPCSLQSQIDRFGNVAIVHSVDGNTVKERVGVDTATYFGVFWDAESFPQASSSCDGISTCQVQGDTCLCDASVTTTHVYDGSTQLPPLTSSDLLSELYIGAPDPLTFDQDYYTLCTATLCAQHEYNIYSLTNVNDDINYALAFDEDTIFEVESSSGSVLYLSNTKSMVDVGGGYSFRNAPQYNSPVDPTQRDGLAETDAILDGLIKHPNVAPFMSKKLIQHLVTSNPSPRYVETVANAFSGGTYTSDGLTFGSGEYGSLEATVAAVILHSEARSTTLDDDGNSGRSREPLLKNIHLLRSMELATSDGSPREIDMIYLMERGLGQEAFRASSVFGFYSPDYAPVGPVLNKGLVGPETQLYDAPKLMSAVNGMFSLPFFGLSDCVWWQGFGNDRSRYWLTDYPDAGTFDCWNDRNHFEYIPLRFRWKPPSWGGETNVADASVTQVINDVDLLLTGGRLYSTSRAILEQVYADALLVGDDNSALNAVLQHYSAVPEFQITNNLMDSSTTTTTVREVPDNTVPVNPPPVTGYKAIVYLYMAGAADSYSMLVPTSSCGSLYDDYRSVRGDVALPLDPSKFDPPYLDPLPIDVTSSNQPCNSMGMHPSLANIHSLFESGDASWTAGIGPMVEPLNAEEFAAGSKPVPQALFAHNTQTSVTQSVFSQDSTVGGVLGRLGDVLNEQAGEDIFDAYSISGTPKILEGAPGVRRVADVLSGNGVSSFNYLITPEYEENIEALSQNIATSIYGETYSSSMTNAISRMRLLDGVVGDTSLVGDACFDNLGTDIADQLWQVARMTNNRDGLESHRDVFYTQIGGFDTHSDNHLTLASLLTEIDDAIGCFKAEMDNQGIWNNVTVASASEFGRTLTSNGLGTDHAWSGNHFLLGGSVKGGIIHGDYPADLTDSGDLNIGRGRLIPTTSWEGQWNGLSEWLGVAPENMEAVLPNKNNFQSNIFSEADLFD